MLYDTFYWPIYSFSWSLTFLSISECRMLIIRFSIQFDCYLNNVSQWNVSLQKIISTNYKHLTWKLNLNATDQYVWEPCLSSLLMKNVIKIFKEKFQINLTKQNKIIILIIKIRKWATWWEQNGQKSWTKTSPKKMYRFSNKHMKMCTSYVIKEMQILKNKEISPCTSTNSFFF